MYVHDSKSCRKKTKKEWVEKRKPSREDTEKMDDALKHNKSLQEGSVPIENVEAASQAVKEVIQNQCEEVSVVNESQMESGEVQVPERDQSGKDQHEGTWTPVMTRRKA
ncbi:hypothetical protein RIF29_26012 [Crotalaria pallida]|uniref:Uncharacterized protein n=1 Tax=Crotalaria pallida TaxID=3830 RepID=A0AAN9I1G3_CROPI